MPRRYCPLCKAYTMWAEEGHSWCEHDGTHSRDQVRVYVGRRVDGWKYMFERISGTPLSDCPCCSHQEDEPYGLPCCSHTTGRCYHWVAVAGDEAAACRQCGDKSLHGDLHWILIEAMVAEMDAGVFEPEMWRNSFPKRTARLIKYQKEVLAGALAALPPVLVGIVGAYL